MRVDHYHFTHLTQRPDVDVDINGDGIQQADMAAHDHDFVEIAVVLAGRAHHGTVCRRYPMRRGDAFVIRPGAWHSYEDCDRLSLMNCCFRASLLEHELGWLVEDPRLRYLLWPSEGDGLAHVRLPPSALCSCVDTFEQLASPPATQARVHQIANVMLLLTTLASCLDDTQLAEVDRFASTDACVALALQAMTTELAHPWTMAELAAAASVSPAHLSRLFHRSMGRPPIAHLSVLRAEAAAARLLRSDQSIAAVGAAVGWDDPNYFARRFRTHFGVSPTEFRERRSG